MNPNDDDLSALLQTHATRHRAGPGLQARVRSRILLAGLRDAAGQLVDTARPRPAHSHRVPSSPPYASWHSWLNRTSTLGWLTARRAITLDDCAGVRAGRRGTQQVGSREGSAGC